MDGRVSATCLGSAATPAIVIAAEDAAGPWGQSDGTGCGNEIVLAAYAAAKVPARLNVMPYARARNGVMQGDYAGCFGMAWTPDMQGKVRFADRPLYSVSALLVHATARPLKAASAKELPPGTKVGTVYQYEYPSNYYDLVKHGTLVPRPAYNEVTSLRNLDLGRVEAALLVVDELKNPDYLIATAGLTGKVRPAFVLGTQGTYVGFSTIHPQGDYARRMFNEGFTIIQKDGTFKRIIDAWKGKLHAP
ncbi:MAG TPA: transporter substrate-binding domain-containing protein [Holophaga sp.]|nr:transporter substrate-binding domain-containing protein [Holophaga sp.]